MTEPEGGPKMVPDRQVQETIARCVGIIVYHRNGETTAKAKALMVAEVQAVAASVHEMGWEPGRIVRGVEVELVARYGPQVGARVHDEFVRAFALPVSNRATA